MKCLGVVALVSATFLVTQASRADDLAQATRVIEGQTTRFPDTSLAEGVKTFTTALESCHAMSDGTVTYTNEDIKKAMKGDYVRLVFATPLKVTVLDKGLAVSEATFAGGVFWLQCGKDIVRCTKYEFDKTKPFVEWSRQALPVD